MIKWAKEAKKDTKKEIEEDTKKEVEDVDKAERDDICCFCFKPASGSLFIIFSKKYLKIWLNFH